MALVRVLTIEQRRSNTHDPGASDPADRLAAMDAG
jgi:hypothetical protein